MAVGVHTGALQPLPPLQPEAVPYDERPLPAVHKQPGAAEEPEKRDLDASEAPRVAAAGEPEPLTEKALREASPAIEVLGEGLVRGSPGGGGSVWERALMCTATS